MVSPDECLVLRHFKSLYSSDESSLLLSDASRSFVAIVSKNGFSVESIGKLFDPMVLVSGTQVPLTNHIIWITLHSNTQSPQFRSSQFTYISCLLVVLDDTLYLYQFVLHSETESTEWSHTDSKNRRLSVLKSSIGSLSHLTSSWLLNAEQPKPFTFISTPISFPVPSPHLFTTVLPDPIHDSDYFFLSTALPNRVLLIIESRAVAVLTISCTGLVLTARRPLSLNSLPPPLSSHGDASLHAHANVRRLRADRSPPSAPSTPLTTANDPSMPSSLPVAGFLKTLLATKGTLPMRLVSIAANSKVLIGLSAPLEVPNKKDATCVSLCCPRKSSQLDRDILHCSGNYGNTHGVARRSRDSIENESFASAERDNSQEREEIWGNEDKAGSREEVHIAKEIQSKVQFAIIWSLEEETFEPIMCMPLPSCSCHLPSGSSSFYLNNQNGFMKSVSKDKLYHSTVSNESEKRRNSMDGNINASRTSIKRLEYFDIKLLGEGDNFVVAAPSHALVVSPRAVRRLATLAAQAVSLLKSLNLVPSAGDAIVEIIKIIESQRRSQPYPLPRLCELLRSFATSLAHLDVHLDPQSPTVPNKIQLLATGSLPPTADSLLVQFHMTGASKRFWSSLFSPSIPCLLQMLRDAQREKLNSASALGASLQSSTIHQSHYGASSTNKFELMALEYLDQVEPEAVIDLRNVLTMIISRSPMISRMLLSPSLAPFESGFSLFQNRSIDEENQLNFFHNEDGFQSGINSKQPIVNNSFQSQPSVDLLTNQRCLVTAPLNTCILPPPQCSIEGLSGNCGVQLLILISRKKHNFYNVKNENDLPIDQQEIPASKQQQKSLLTSKREFLILRSSPHTHQDLCVSISHQKLISIHTDNPPPPPTTTTTTVPTFCPFFLSAAPLNCIPFLLKDGRHLFLRVDHKTKSSTLVCPSIPTPLKDKLMLRTPELQRMNHSDMQELHMIQLRSAIASRDGEKLTSCFSNILSKVEEGSPTGKMESNAVQDAVRSIRELYTTLHNLILSSTQTLKKQIRTQCLLSSPFSSFSHCLRSEFAFMSAGLTVCSQVCFALLPFLRSKADAGLLAEFSSVIRTCRILSQQCVHAFVEDNTENAKRSIDIIHALLNDESIFLPKIVHQSSFSTGNHNRTTDIVNGLLIQNSSTNSTSFPVLANGTAEEVQLLQRIGFALIMGKATTAVSIASQQSQNLPSSVIKLVARMLASTIPSQLAVAITSATMLFREAGLSISYEILRIAKSTLSSSLRSCLISHLEHSGRLSLEAHERRALAFISIIEVLSPLSEFRVALNRLWMSIYNPHNENNNSAAATNNSQSNQIAPASVSVLSVLLDLGVFSNNDNISNSSITLNPLEAMIIRNKLGSFNAPSVKSTSQMVANKFKGVWKTLKCSTLADESSPDIFGFSCPIPFSFLALELIAVASRELFKGGNETIIRTALESACEAAESNREGASIVFNAEQKKTLINRIVAIVSKVTCRICINQNEMIKDHPFNQSANNLKMITRNSTSNVNKTIITSSNISRTDNSLLALNKASIPSANSVSTLEGYGYSQITLNWTRSWSTETICCVLLEAAGLFDKSKFATTPADAFAAATRRIAVAATRVARCVYPWLSAELDKLVSDVSTANKLHVSMLINHQNFSSLESIISSSPDIKPSSHDPLHTPILSPASPELNVPTLQTLCSALQCSAVSRDVRSAISWSLAAKGLLISTSSISTPPNNLLLQLSARASRLLSLPPNTIESPSSPSPTLLALLNFVSLQRSPSLLSKILLSRRVGLSPESTLTLFSSSQNSISPAKFFSSSPREMITHLLAVHGLYTLFAVSLHELALCPPPALAPYLPSPQVDSWGLPFHSLSSLASAALSVNSLEQSDHANSSTPLPVSPSILLVLSLITIAPLNVVLIPPSSPLMPWEILDNDLKSIAECAPPSLRPLLRTISSQIQPSAPSPGVLEGPLFMRCYQMFRAIPRSHASVCENLILDEQRFMKAVAIGSAKDLKSSNGDTALVSAVFSVRIPIHVRVEDPAFLPPQPNNKPANPVAQLPSSMKLYLTPPNHRDVFHWTPPSPESLLNPLPLSIPLSAVMEVGASLLVRCQPLKAAAVLLSSCRSVFVPPPANSTASVSFSYLSTSLTSSYVPLQNLVDFINRSSHRRSPAPLIEDLLAFAGLLSHTNNANKSCVLPAHFRQLVLMRTQQLNLVHFLNEKILTSILVCLELLNETPDTLRTDSLAARRLFVFNMAKRQVSPPTVKDGILLFSDLKHKMAADAIANSIIDLFASFTANTAQSSIINESSSNNDNENPNIKTNVKLESENNNNSNIVSLKRSNLSSAIPPMSLLHTDVDQHDLVRRQNLEGERGAALLRVLKNLEDAARALDPSLAPERASSDDPGSAADSISFTSLSVQYADLLNFVDMSTNKMSPWETVAAFCKQHQLPRSLTLLHELARADDWLLFLEESDAQQCPLDTLQTIVSSFFQELAVRTHLSNVLSLATSKTYLSTPNSAPAVASLELIKSKTISPDFTLGIDTCPPQAISSLSFIFKAPPSLPPIFQTSTRIHEDDALDRAWRISREFKVEGAGICVRLLLHVRQILQTEWCTYSEEILHIRARILSSYTPLLCSFERSCPSLVLVAFCAPNAPANIRKSAPVWYLLHCLTQMQTINSVKNAFCQTVERIKIKPHQILVPNVPISNFSPVQLTSILKSLSSGLVDVFSPSSTENLKETQKIIDNAANPVTIVLLAICILLKASPRALIALRRVTRIFFGEESSIVSIIGLSISTSTYRVQSFENQLAIIEEKFLNVENINNNSNLTKNSKRQEDNNSSSNLIFPSDLSAECFALILEACFEGILQRSSHILPPFLSALRRHPSLPLSPRWRFAARLASVRSLSSSQLDPHSSNNISLALHSLTSSRQFKDATELSTISNRLTVEVHLAALCNSLHQILKPFSTWMTSSTSNAREWTPSLANFAVPPQLALFLSSVTCDLPPSQLRLHMRSEFAVSLAFLCASIPTSNLLSLSQESSISALPLLVDLLITILKDQESHLTALDQISLIATLVTICQNKNSSIASFEEKTLFKSPVALVFIVLSSIEICTLEIDDLVPLRALISQLLRDPVLFAANIVLQNPQNLFKFLSPSTPALPLFTLMSTSSPSTSLSDALLMPIDRALANACELCLHEEIANFASSLVSDLCIPPTVSFIRRFRDSFTILNLLLSSNTAFEFGGMESIREVLLNLSSTDNNFLIKRCSVILEAAVQLGLSPREVISILSSNMSSTHVESLSDTKKMHQDDSSPPITTSTQPQNIEDEPLSIASNSNNSTVFLVNRPPRRLPMKLTLPLSVPLRCLSAAPLIRRLVSILPLFSPSDKFDTLTSCAASLLDLWRPLEHQNLLSNFIDAFEHLLRTCEPLSTPLQIPDSLSLQHNALEVLADLLVIPLQNLAVPSDWYVQSISRICELGVSAEIHPLANCIAVSFAIIFARRLCLSDVVQQLHSDLIPVFCRSWSLPRKGCPTSCRTSINQLRTLMGHLTELVKGDVGEDLDLLSPFMPIFTMESASKIGPYCMSIIIRQRQKVRELTANNTLQKEVLDSTLWVSAAAKDSVLSLNATSNGSSFISQGVFTMSIFKAYLEENAFLKVDRGTALRVGSNMRLALLASLSSQLKEDSSVSQRATYKSEWTSLADALCVQRQFLNLEWAISSESCKEQYSSMQSGSHGLLRMEQLTRLSLANCLLVISAVHSYDLARAITMSYELTLGPDIHSVWPAALLRQEILMYCCSSQYESIGRETTSSGDWASPSNYLKSAIEEWGIEFLDINLLQRLILLFLKFVEGVEPNLMIEADNYLHEKLFRLETVEGFTITQENLLMDGYMGKATKEEIFLEEDVHLQWLEEVKCFFEISPHLRLFARRRIVMIIQQITHDYELQDVLLQFLSIYAKIAIK